MPDQDIQIRRFAELFKGRDTAKGKYIPKRSNSSEKTYTIRERATKADWKNHLQGKIGLGQVPILTNNTCNFGAIDVDNKGKRAGRLIKLEKTASRIIEKELPLIVCRSKSGGMHLYTFMDEPVTAHVLRRYLSQWARLLGFGGSEIFPAQDQAEDVGNWINLPYFGGDEGEEQRLAYGPDGSLSLEEFLEGAEYTRQLPKFIDAGGVDLSAESEDEVAQMPPCLRHYVSHPAEEGARNEILWNYGVYYKRANRDESDSWHDQVHKANQLYLKKPLSAREVTSTIIKSIKKKEYHYKCSMPDLEAYCDRVQCKGLKFGLTPNEAEFIAPRFTNLQKIETNPPTWNLMINGERVHVEATVDLLDYRRVRILAAEQLSIGLLAQMKQNDWDVTVARLMKNDIQYIHAPNEASEHAPIIYQLDRFLARFEEDPTMEHLGQGKVYKVEMTDRRDPTEYSPDIVDGDTFGKKINVVAFSPQDFVEFCRNRRVQIPPMNRLWKEFMNMGFGHIRMRKPKSGRGSKKFSIWYLPMDLIPDSSEQHILPIKKADKVEV